MVRMTKKEGKKNMHNDLTILFKTLGAIKMKKINNKGFAMIAALMALLILTAVGALVFTITTQDIRVSTRVIGEKKAFSAAQAGIHALSEFADSKKGVIHEVLDYEPTKIVVDSSGDSSSKFTIRNSKIPGAPDSLYMPGYQVGGTHGSQKLHLIVLGKSVTGINERYNSKVEIDVGIGYGPIPPGTAY